MILKTATNSEFNIGRSDIYFNFLKDLTKEQFDHGVKRILAERVYNNMPSIAEIRQYALDATTADKQNNEITEKEQRELAKLEIKEQIKKAGRYNRPIFTDNKLYAVIRAEGWGKLCSMTKEEIDWFIKTRFTDLYSVSTDKIENALTHNSKNQVITTGILKKVSYKGEL